ncbi:MAG: hypothetical protein ACRC7G_16190 [Beijerinckiaceae bacterium]
MRRTVLIYALLGPLAGALVYLALSVAARLLGATSNLFAPLAQGGEIAASLGAASWRIGPALLLTWMPAVLTGFATARVEQSQGSCAWWTSCLIGAVFSGAGGYALIALGRALYPEADFIPPPAPGAALIALVGFVGTWPCWLAAYRSSPQNR